METKKSHCPTRGGFSLVELICVVAIIAMLSQLALQSIETFVDKAKNAEAATNLGVAMGLAKSYFDDNPNVAAGFSLFNLSTNVYTNSDSCLYTNPLGFKIRNCTKTNFVYAMGYASNTQFSVFAVEGGTTGAKRIQPKCKGASMWLNHVTAGLKHSIDTTQGNNCNECFIVKTMSMQGSTDLGFDFDGNGSVDLNDSSSPAGWMQMSPSFGTPLSHIGDC